MKRISFRLIAFILAFIFIIPSSFIRSEAYTFAEINARNVFLKQKTNYTCTLASAAMMLRRATIIKGKESWSSITENALRKYAWLENQGLWSNFSYMGFTVKSKSLPGGSENKNKLISILKEHPEGIILYDRGTPHAILLTDYTDGKFYCADPAESRSKGRISIGSAMGVTINNADKYWYISSGLSKKYLTLEPEEKKHEEKKNDEKKQEEQKTPVDSKTEEPDPVGVIVKSMENVGIEKIVDRSSRLAALLLASVLLTLRI